MGRRTCPNWMSHAAVSVRTSSGKAIDRRCSRCRHSRSTPMSNRRLPARMVYVTDADEGSNVVAYAHATDQRPVRDHVDRARALPRCREPGRPRLDVPGVVSNGPIRRQFQHRGVLADGQQLAGVCEIDDRGERSRLVPSHGEVSIRHRPLGDDDPVVGGDLDGGRDRVGANLHPPGPVAVDLHDLVAVDRSGVGDVEIGGHEPIEQHPEAPFELCRDRRVHTLGVAMHPRDRRPGQDVVELLSEHLPPQMVDVGRCAGCRRPELDLAEEPLTSAIADLRPELARQRAAVCLEVELAPPHRYGCTREMLRVRPARRTRPPTRWSPEASRRGRPGVAPVRASPASARRLRRRTRTASATSRTRRRRGIAPMTGRTRRV